MFRSDSFLTFGARYANTDYVVVRSASHNPETKKVVSYNIMCQWGKNLRTRLQEVPLENAEVLDDHIVARVVPKFHLAAHKETCRINFSLNYEPGVGRSDMEGPERTWFGLQGGGTTKDQGPRTRVLERCNGRRIRSLELDETCTPRYGRPVLFFSCNGLTSSLRHAPCKEVFQRPHAGNNPQQRICSPLCRHSDQSS